MDDKGFHMSMREVNGEQQYDYDYFIEEPTEEEAWRIARDYASRFYGEDEDGNPASALITGYDDAYEFHCGCIWVSITKLIPTTRQEFTRHILERYTFRRRSAV